MEYSNIRNSPSYSTFKKNILNFIRPHSNDVFNVSHPKGLVFLTCLRVVLSHLREHKFKHSFLDKYNSVCIFGFDIETSNHFFPHCPRFTNERQNVLLKSERIVADILRNTDTNITPILLYTNWSFQLSLTPTCSVHLLTTSHP